MNYTLNFENLLLLKFIIDRENFQVDQNDKID